MNIVQCRKLCCKLSYWDFIGDKNRPFSNEEKAGAIIMSSKKEILIVKSRGSKWGFPKGGRESNETIIECAEREVKEETGFSISLKNCVQKKYGTIILFIKRIKMQKQPDIENITNDCCGIGWVNKDCLAELIEDRKININFSLRSFIR